METKEQEQINCICCGEECIDMGNGILECSNCDENYGTSKCKCRGN